MTGRPRAGRAARVAALAALLVGAGACDDAPSTPAGPNLEPTAEVADGAAPAGDLADAEAPDVPTPSADLSAGPVSDRGEYLVRHVLGCGNCHTPRREDGSLDGERFLSGDPCFGDRSPPADNGVGCLAAPNLTNHATGLAGWTDLEIITAVTLGRHRGGRQLSAQMPYYQWHALVPDDLAAVIAYLRRVPGVDRAIPPSESPYLNAAFAAAAPLVVGDMPRADGPDPGAAERGRYLAVIACVGCHTPKPTEAITAVRPIDIARALSGGQTLPRRGQTSTTISANLTPDDSGLAGWTADDIVRAVRAGTTRAGSTLCAPMPAGPSGSFGGLGESDARDIAVYLQGLAPVANRFPRSCP